MITVKFTEIADRTNSFTESFESEEAADEAIHEAWADGWTARRQRAEPVAA